MQHSDSPATAPISTRELDSPKSRKSTVTEDAENSEDNNKAIDDIDDGLVLDVSGKSLEFALLENFDDSVGSLYLYKNVFSLVPRAVGRLRRLRTLKFFGNEVNLFPMEFGNLVGLECLQVKVSSTGLNGLALDKLKGLKELELSKVPPRPSVLSILSEIAGLRCLTKLSVCHFSIRYLPPEMGCLNNLEYLDLSFNKIKRLPSEISYLTSLISLKVANNKLVELPSGLASLQRLENLDLSNNRLTSLCSLDLDLMHSLQNLNLQYNKLNSCCQIPTWICCNLEGNGKDSSNDDLISSSVEMDVYETTIQDNNRSFSCNVSYRAASNLLAGSMSNSRCFATRRSNKRWRRRHYLQQKARQERLNNSRKWKGDGHYEALNVEAGENCKSGVVDVLDSETLPEGVSDTVGLDDDDDKQLPSGETEGVKLLISIEDDKIISKKGIYVEDCSSVGLGSLTKAGKDECCVHDASLVSSPNQAGHVDEACSSSDISKTTSKSKRHSDGDLINPKHKCQKPTNGSSSLSCKYNKFSFCGSEDRLPDGFYDAGRDRPFMPLESYEQILHLDSREVILVDSGRDEELDAIVLSAQALVLHLKRLNGFAKDGEQVAIDNLQIASLLALFVSDQFGGSDRSAVIERTKKTVSGSNYRKPFVCTCSTGNSNSISTSTEQKLGNVEDFIFTDLCEKSLRSIKARRKSIVVPLGTLQFGVCRHRALLMKYLCDRMKPPVPCELVRGYLDFLPHAWNSILIKRGDSWVRMVVDACHPLDIREETDPEFFCRYIPLSRTKVPLSTESIPGPGCSFPSFSACDEIEKAASSSLIRCKFGAVEAAVKVRTLEVGTPGDETMNFEYSFLGELRMLGALQHSCIVEMYGHKISSKWIASKDGKPERRILQSAIFMEYVKGGSLKSYIERLSEAGEKHVPIELVLCIAQDVACALATLHSKHIIHRDIKSENVLIDLDSKKADGRPIVKLCDFDRAVPLRSYLHTCCIGHRGIPPPDVCVGTPRWMAPEVLRAMHKRDLYGLEVDIWSYGCLLLELLTLQVPYSGLSELHIHDLIQRGRRPQLTVELESLGLLNEPATSQSVTLSEGAEAEVETLRFLVDLFHRCTEENPADRPKAEDLYKMLLTHKSTYTSSRNYEEV